MQKNIILYINKLEGYKTSIKNLHWDSNNMSEHKLLDEIASSVSDIQDKVAEVAQGIYGKIKKNELKPIKYKITNSKLMLKDLLADTFEFYKRINNVNLIGIKSEIESFIGDINQFQYLMDFCLKEDIKRKFKKILN